MYYTNISFNHFVVIQSPQLWSITDENSAVAMVTNGVVT